MPPFLQVLLSAEVTCQAAAWASWLCQALKFPFSFFTRCIKGLIEIAQIPVLGAGEQFEALGHIKLTYSLTNLESPMMDMVLYEIVPNSFFHYSCNNLFKFYDLIRTPRNYVDVIFSLLCPNFIYIFLFSRSFLHHTMPTKLHLYFI